MVQGLGFGLPGSGRIGWGLGTAFWGFEGLSQRLKGWDLECKSLALGCTGCGSGFRVGSRSYFG